ncbi:MAG: cytochrome c-type biogenesis protein CcmH [Motiliproteus sp.]|jgi:cytochrome c-type biogenesis protein CcmH
MAFLSLGELTAMMNFFWPILVVLVLCALAFIWWPWLRNRAQIAPDKAALDRNQLNVNLFKQRTAELELELAQGSQDQAAFEALRFELEQNLLQEVDDTPTPEHNAQQRQVWIPLAMTLLVPLLSFYLYLELGSSALLPQSGQTVQAANLKAGNDLSAIEAQVSALEARLETEPDNAEGWFTLGRTYLSLQRYQEAYRALAKVGELVGEHPEIISQQAQALYFFNDHQMSPAVQQHIDRALALDPQSPGALGLLGISAYETGQFKKAIDIWRGLISSDHPGVDAQRLGQAIQEATRQLAQQGIEYAPQTSEPQQAATGSPAATASLRVLVELDPALKGSVAPDTILFVYAQAVTGSKMPLAAARFKVSDLPVRVTLDDSMAMGPMAKLSSAEQVQVRATISFSGTPGAKPGDILGVVSPVSVPGNDELIKILINERVN